MVSNGTVVRRMLNPYFSEDPTGERAGAESDVVAQQVLSGALCEAIGAPGRCAASTGSTPQMTTKVVKSHERQVVAASARGHV